MLTLNLQSLVGEPGRVGAHGVTAPRTVVTHTSRTLLELRAEGRQSGRKVKGHGIMGVMKCLDFIPEATGSH